MAMLNVHYFSYGSNMSIRRLRERVPGAGRIGTGALQGHRLAFHKISSDGSAKCDAVETGDPADIVHGVVFTLSAREKNVLDQVEGSGYGVKDVRIKLEQGGIIEAYTYYATRIDPALKPLDWYLEHVLTGARENRLPESYIRLIESFEACEDQDRARRHVELSIYR